MRSCATRVRWPWRSVTRDVVVVIKLMRKKFGERFQFVILVAAFYTVAYPVLAHPSFGEASHGEATLRAVSATQGWSSQWPVSRQSPRP